MAATAEVRVSLVGAGHPNFAERSTSVQMIDGLMVTSFDADGDHPLPYIAFKQGRERAAEQWARSAIRAALVRSRGNTTEAARLLRMNRTAMLRLISKYGLR